MWAVPVVAIMLYLVGYDGWVYVIEYFGVAVFLAYWVVKSYEMKASLVETREGLREAAERTVGPGGGTGAAGERGTPADADGMLPGGDS
jgi:hypothetical protein